MTRKGGIAMKEFVKLYCTDAEFFIGCTWGMLALVAVAYFFYRICKEK